MWAAWLKEKLSDLADFGAFIDIGGIDGLIAFVTNVMEMG